MVEVRIPSTMVLNDYHLYNIEIVVSPERQVHKLSKRFSDFVEFKKELEASLHRTIPYSLPSKYSSLYKSKESTIEQRRVGLCEFLQGLLNDESLRNDTHVLEFLYLGENTFTASEAADGLQTGWADESKSIKTLLQTVRSKLFARDTNLVDCKRIMDTCGAKLDKLERFQDEDGLGAGEKRRRQNVVGQQRKEYEELCVLVRSMINANGLSSPAKPAFKRSLGKAKETQETKPLDNQQLYQHQQVLMTQQDESLDQLRGILQRQKQIGLTINEELSVQNELLRGLDDQIDISQRKMNSAKTRIGKIL
ncbi:hypothetical protein OGAPHI_006496 [Ogataea philodendri]|uniref:Uncharacterized protein n=1 Tax=Ogataea philodendri TaxID=1378263 RepID=A0A9P8NYM6_9ASCO|nr:uncharacterized protein OGAPHI_006496 [Ogataea philodendri]KAH3661646.1 hypothetical protein OGAPHI_006496 [Ogataea philodendri]